MAVVNLTSVKSVNCGGRLHTAIDTNSVRKNGELGFLGVYAGQAEGLREGQTQIHKFSVPTGASLQKTLPVIIMQPEMMYDNSRQSNLKLEKFDIKAGETFTCVPLEEGDKFEVTSDLLRNKDGNTVGAGELQVGKCYFLKEGQTVLNLTAASGGGNPPVTDGTIYFEIVKIKDAHARSARINRAFMNDNYNLYTLEVKVKR